VPSWLEALPSGAAGAFWSAFRDLYLAESGAISRKHRALMALATAAALREERATLFHAEIARLLGATDVEVAEATAVAGLAAFAATTMVGQRLEPARLREETLREAAFARVNGGVRGDSAGAPHPAGDR
jgi:alkylhydroperoxidase/carboxymuconolactone decarboxylase family protein YurZ